ncbi:four-carbon acid sugar kinase family protein [Peribacillus loiseleuriae]|uniref:four-carbon acid sugar kinase family protein n=1 Tax=Peribacillus loiseleuriae TaxID=1679170 RepID=UPI003D0846AC
MKLAIIADDLTGANDSGVQLALHGLKTTVLFDLDEINVKRYEAVVFDTDSRSSDRKEAYEKVKQVAEFLKNAGFKNIFKKLDSTMRGNIGAEIDAVYEVLKPDFVMIAPGYPKNNRTILQSALYLQGVPLEETEISKDPKTPVKQSYLPELLKEQTKHAIGTITVDDIEHGEQFIQEKMKDYFQKKITYLIIDSTEEHHLEQILNYTKKLTYQFTWVGSAGIANYLPDYYAIPKRNNAMTIPKNTNPTLTIIGGLNKNSRAQMTVLLEKTTIHAIPFESYKAVSDNMEKISEIRSVYHEAVQKAQEGLDVLIYSTGEKEDIEKAWRIGALKGLSHSEISNEIVKAIGTVSSALLDSGHFTGVTMTGGDTAKQICTVWDVKGFELLDELEIGVPISKFLGNDRLYAVTKAGGFGSENVFIHAIKKLKGDN